MPKRKSQLSRHTSHTRSVKVRRMRETSSEHAQRLARGKEYRTQASARGSSTERPRRLVNHRQNMLEIRDRIRNRSAPHSNRSAFNYDPNIDYSKQGAMSKACPKCFAKKWSDEPSGMCCAAGKLILPDIEEPPQPLNSLLTSNHTYSIHFLNNIPIYNTLFQMTTFGTKEIIQGNLMPTFKIEGQIYHLIGSLLPTTGQSIYLPTAQATLGGTAST